MKSLTLPSWKKEGIDSPLPPPAPTTTNTTTCRKSDIGVSLQINHGICCAASLCIMGAVTSQLGKVWNNNQGEITQCHETSAANINGNILTLLLSRGVSSNDLERSRLSFHPSVRLVNNRQSLSALAVVICWSKGSGGLIIFIQRKWPLFPLLRKNISKWPALLGHSANQWMATLMLDLGFWNIASPEE